MAAWVLVPCLVRLRTDLNNLCPDRDKRSDGTIGDAAHQSSVSDHNDDEVGRVPIRDADSKHEVHAFDADADLREPGLTMEMVVQHILTRCRSGAEKRLRYIIFNRRIWEASNGWRQRTYTGSSPHSEHAHFSSSYVTAREADTSSWHLEDIPVALTQADKNWLAAQISASEKRTAQLIEQRIAEVPEEVWTATRNVNVGPRAIDPLTGERRPPSMQQLGQVLAYLSPEGHLTRQKLDAIAEDVTEIKEEALGVSGAQEGQA